MNIMRLAVAAVVTVPALVMKVICLLNEAVEGRTSLVLVQLMVPLVM